LEKISQKGQFFLRKIYQKELSPMEKKNRPPMEKNALNRKICRKDRENIKNRKED